MSTIKPESCTEYNQRLAREIPMPLIQWKAIKGILYSGIAVGASIALSLTDGSWMQIAVVCATVLLIFGVELEEITVANLFTITFDADNATRSDEGDDDS